MDSPTSLPWIGMLALLWLLGLALAVVLLQGRGYVRGTIKLLKAPFRWSGRMCRRLCALVIRRMVRAIERVVSCVAVWLFERLKRW